LRTQATTNPVRTAGASGFLFSIQRYRRTAIVVVTRASSPIQPLVLARSVAVHARECRFSSNSPRISSVPSLGQETLSLGQSKRGYGRAPFCIVSITSNAVLAAGRHHHNALSRMTPTPQIPPGATTRRKSADR
jgi:hypothetical protein